MHAFCITLNLSWEARRLPAVEAGGINTCFERVDVGMLHVRCVVWLSPARCSCDAEFASRPSCDLDRYVQF